MKLMSLQQGKLYSLEQIRPITSKLKFILSRPSQNGLFFLYKQIENNHLWIGGPFNGAESNAFLYLGKHELPKGLTTSFSKIILRNLENDWKKFEEMREMNRQGIIMESSLPYRNWAIEFFSFDNRDFNSFFD